MVDKLTLPATQNEVQLKVNDIIDNTNLGDLKNVTISNPSAGQNLTYDATNQVWKNTSTTATVAWGGITGTLSDQTDLQNALNGKADDSDFVGADGTSAGSAGLVPAPTATDNTKFLKGDGTWGTVDALPSQTSQSGKFLTTDGSTASWGTPPDTKNTAGSTDTSSKIFLVGATSQAANPQTYSQDTAFVDTDGRLNSAAPAADANDTTVATTKWVADKGYTNTTVTFRVWS